MNNSSATWFTSLVKNKKTHKYFNPADDILLGRMFLYQYDPKFKAVLPVWDEFPLVIPIRLYEDGFLGINFHFLQPAVRKAIVNQMLKTVPMNKAAARSVSYNMFKSISKSAAVSGALKRYLLDHVESKLVIVDHEFWLRAVDLPIAKFYTN